MLFKSVAGIVYYLLVSCTTTIYFLCWRCWMTCFNFHFHTEKEYVCILTNSKGRNEWEIQFNQTYIQPILEVSLMNYWFKIFDWYDFPFRMFTHFWKMQGRRFWKMINRVWKISFMTLFYDREHKYVCIYSHYLHWKHVVVITTFSSLSLSHSL